jgi:hypothetical protein
MLRRISVVTGANTTLAVTLALVRGVNSQVTFEADGGAKLAKANVALTVSAVEKASLRYMGQVDRSCARQRLRAVRRAPHGALQQPRSSLVGCAVPGRGSGALRRADPRSAPARSAFHDPWVECFDEVRERLGTRARRQREARAPAVVP